MSEVVLCVDRHNCSFIDNIPVWSKLLFNIVAYLCVHIYLYIISLAMTFVPANPRQVQKRS
jgi:hypothetical protein